MTRAEILSLFQLPFNDLLWQAHQTHRENFDPNTVQLSSLISIKTGGCAEDCAYCTQSAHFDTGSEVTSMAPVGEVVAAAKKAQAAGATRFCMGAAWRGLKDRDLAAAVEMIRAVKALGMETCMTLGMVTDAQATALKEIGLDYYNHNIDTSPEYYGKVVTTHDYHDRLATLGSVRKAGIKVCTGGIIGMGESRDDRAGMLETLANMNPHPDSVPINMLVAMPGTPFAGVPPLSPLEMVRMVAAARILMPRSYVRLSAGRKGMTAETQALCFFAGANSIFYGDKLLTADNRDLDEDRELFAELGISAQLSPA